MKIELTALTGMRQAEARFNKSAENVVTAFLNDDGSNPTVEPVRPVETATQQSTTTFTANESGLIENAVSMTEATQSYAANAKVFKTWSETMERALSELIDEKK